MTTNGVIVCRRPTGGECWQLAFGPTVSIAEQWAGWYAFGYETRYSSNAPPPQPALPVPPVRTNLGSGALYSLSAPVGPIAAAATASIRSRAVRRKGRLVVGRVTCETRCSVRLKVSGGGRKALTRTLTVRGSASLAIPVRRGRLNVRVTVDGKLAAAGRTRY